MHNHTFCGFEITRFSYLPTAGFDYLPGNQNLVTFEPSGDSVVCTSFIIIDDVIALEGVERFVIDVVPGEGRIDIGRNNRTVITIEDNDGRLIC